MCRQPLQMGVFYNKKLIMEIVGLLSVYIDNMPHTAYTILSNRIVTWYV